MNEGRTTNSKSTIYVGNIDDDVNEQILMEVFSTFGDIMEVQIPTVDRPNFQHGPPGSKPTPFPSTEPAKHRGFAFIAFGTQTDAQDAIDNMDMNEMRGKVLKVNMAKPMKGSAVQGQGNRAIWETEEWLKMYGTKPGSDPATVQAQEGEAAEEEQMEE